MKRVDKNIFMMFGGLILGAGVGVVLLAVFHGTSLGNQPGLQTGTRLEVGSPAPDFSLDTISGQRIRLSEHRGQPTVINFWASWCGPCREEMPLLESIYEEFTPGLTLLAVNADEPLSDVRSFLGLFHLTFPILLDPGGRVGKAYRVSGLPTTYFIDRDGNLRFIHIGSLSESQLRGYLAQIGVRK